MAAHVAPKTLGNSDRDPGSARYAGPDRGFRPVLVGEDRDRHRAVHRLARHHRQQVLRLAGTLREVNEHNGWAGRQQEIQAERDRKRRSMAGKRANSHHRAFPGNVTTRELNFRWARQRLPRPRERPRPGDERQPTLMSDITRTPGASRFGRNRPAREAGHLVRNRSQGTGPVESSRAVAHSQQDQPVAG